MYITLNCYSYLKSEYTTFLRNGAHSVSLDTSLNSAHKIFGLEIQSGIELVGRYLVRSKSDLTNQIVRAGFIR